MARRGSGQIRLPRRLPSVHRRACRGTAGPPGETGELPPGREFFDVRDRWRAVGGHDDGFFTAIRAGERHAARGSRRLRRPLYDGAARLERGRGSPPVGHGRRAGGLSGVGGGDVRDLEAAGTERASVALDVFVYQVKKTIGAFAAAMGGLDAVAFTGGIGENSARLREQCCAGLEFLGIQLDTARNAGTGDRVVSTESSKVTVLALGTNEELIVARRAYGCLEAAVRVLRCCRDNPGRSRRRKRCFSFRFSSPFVQGQRDFFSSGARAFARRAASPREPVAETTDGDPFEKQARNQPDTLGGIAQAFKERSTPRESTFAQGAAEPVNATRPATTRSLECWIRYRWQLGKPYWRAT